jgi:hypothetical protein
MKINTFGLFMVTLIVTYSFSLKIEKMDTIFDFSKTSKIDNWKLVNDDVMGGVSNASFEINSEGNAEFKGTVSTEKNGGFASVRYRFNEINITGKTTVFIRLKGDSKSYQFRVKDKSNNYYSYITSFSTSNHWETVKIKLQDLYPSFRGNKLNKSNFKASSIEEISFLIANKKNETFKLIIDKIEIE